MLSSLPHSFSRALDRSGHLGDVLLLILMFILAIFPPLSTDMYLPALSMVAEDLQTTERITNLTLVFFFIFFAVATLFWGPLSDRIGRKSALLIGIAVYAISSAGCMFAVNIDQLIVARIIQSIGAAAPFTIVFSLVQDRYAGEKKRRILAILSSAMMIAPMIAPSLGSIVLSVANWRMIFGLLLLLGGFSFVGTLFLDNRHQNATSRTNTGLFAGLMKLLGNRLLLKTLLTFSMPAIYILGFVGASALVFMMEFDLTKEDFSLVFAANAGISILGSLLSVQMLKKISYKSILTIAFASLVLSGILILLCGRTNPYIFLLCLLPGSFFMAAIRPLTVDQMMNIAGSDAGAASALVNFLFNVFGCAGMYVVTLQWESTAVAFGVMTFVLGLLCMLFWQIISRDRALRQL